MKKVLGWQFKPFLVPIGLCGLLFLFQSNFLGCSHPSQVATTITPAEQKTREDSLSRAREFEIAKCWSSGYEYYKNKSYAEAKKYLFQITKLDPTMQLAEKFHYKDLHGRLANCYVQENNDDSTEWAYSEGVKYFPDNAFYHESLGNIYRSQSQFEKAIEQYSQAIELQPEKSINYKNIAALYLQTQQLDKAIEAYENYVNLVPTDRAAQDTLAALYRTAGREEEAIAKKEELLAQNSNDPKLLFDLGKAYFQLKNYQKAIERLKQLLIQTPENIDALQYLGGAYMHLERYNDAVNAYKQIIVYQPNQLEILCAVANAYRMLNNFTTARLYVQKALKADPNSGLPLITFGEIYEAGADYCAKQKSGKFGFDEKLVYEKAYFEYQKATKDPNYVDSANQHMDAIRGLLPSTEDRFFNTNQKEPKGDCYRWIF